jgi:hypothetical protein
MLRTSTKTAALICSLFFTAAFTPSNGATNADLPATVANGHSMATSLHALSTIGNQFAAQFPPGEPIADAGVTKKAAKLYGATDRNVRSDALAAKSPDNLFEPFNVNKMFHSGKMLPIATKKGQKIWCLPTTDLWKSQNGKIVPLFEEKSSGCSSSLSFDSPEFKNYQNNGVLDFANLANPDKYTPNSSKGPTNLAAKNFILYASGSFQAVTPPKTLRHSPKISKVKMKKYIDYHTYLAQLSVGMYNLAHILAENVANVANTDTAVFGDAKYVSRATVMRTMATRRIYNPAWVASVDKADLRGLAAEQTKMQAEQLALLYSIDQRLKRLTAASSVMQMQMLNQVKATQLR